MFNIYENISNKMINKNILLFVNILNIKTNIFYIVIYILKLLRNILVNK